MTYIKQLDSIRAIAVLLVIITHWFPEGHFLNIYTSVFNGVDIFFVLSGFLITKILLEDREEAESKEIPKLALIKFFFAKRFIRIFPVYYFLLFVLYALGDRTESNIRGDFFYYITYTANINFFFLKEWDGLLSHLWSLSVEEQFYLIWPWVILFLPKRALPGFICLSVLIGIAAQLLLKEVTFGDILTFSCFDGFGVGALLAWFLKYKPQSLKHIYPYLILIALICFALQIARVAGYSSFVLLPSRTLTSLCTVWLITCVILYEESQSAGFKLILNNPFLIFLGKISYGIYLYHLPIPYLAYRFVARLNFHLPFPFKDSLYFFNLIYFILLLVISYLSWKLIERPLLTYKRHFDTKTLSVYR